MRCGKSFRLGIGVAAALGLGPVTELSAQGSPLSPAWDVTVGGVLLVAPQYIGSDEYRLLPLPYARVSSLDRFYLGPSTAGLGAAAGAYAVRSSHLDIAVEMGVQDERPAERADALAGMADRDLVGTAGASVTLRAGPLQATGAVARGLNDGAGTLGSARVSISRTMGRMIASLDVGAVFADGRQMRRDFGITQSEAAQRRELLADGDDRLRPEDGRAFALDGGLRQVGASVSLVYLLSPRWSLIGFAGMDRLSTEVAMSPLVRRQEQYSAGLGWGFRL